MSKPASHGPSRAARTNASRIASMSARVELARHLVARRVRDRRRTDDRPVPLVERLVHALPHELGRALRPACARAAGRSSRRVHSWTKSTMRFHARDVLRDGTCRVQPGEMRPSRVTQVISVKTSPAPPSARAPRCTRWKSLGSAVDRAVHIHRRDDNAVAQLEVAQTERREHRRNGATPAGEPSLDLARHTSLSRRRRFS